jgi:acyl-CoA synthetase (NDP forming)
MNTENAAAVEEILGPAKAGKRKVLDLWEARQVLSGLGVPMDRAVLAVSKEEAVSAAGKIGYPVAMKIVSGDIIHKTEVGGVKINLSGEKEVGDAMDAMMASVRQKQPSAKIRGVLIEEMVRGTELIIGSTCDPQFGRMIMFGMGGVFVEIYRDVSFRLVPIADFDAREMIEEIKGKAIFEGARGFPKADKNAIVRILLAISAGLQKHPDIDELDINPLMVTEKGVIAVDARVILGELGKACQQ